MSVNRHRWQMATAWLVWCLWVSRALGVLYHWPNATQAMTGFGFWSFYVDCYPLS
jgi:hypothetical protein